MTYTTPVGPVYNLFLSMLSQAHLLVAGTTGSGKSVLVNGLICTALHRLPIDTPGGAQLILIDPKRTELFPYKDLPHVLCYATEPAAMIAALQYAVNVTEGRYKAMEKAGARKYTGSDIYVVIEELADLMTTNRKTVQPLIQRLCQIARAARVHVIAVTQCPLVKVIPTEIKVNFDGIVALRTRSAQDSRNIIGCNGAEILPRYGECLYICPDLMNATRYLVPYVTDGEQASIIAFWKKQRPAKRIFCKLFGRG